MVGLQILVLRIGVRVPASQPSHSQALGRQYLSATFHPTGNIGC